MLPRHFLFLQLGNLRELFSCNFPELGALDPLRITSRRFPQEVVPRQNNKLTPISFGYKAWQIVLAKNTLEALGQYAGADLTQEERVNKAILEWSLVQKVDGEKYYCQDV